MVSFIMYSHGFIYLHSDFRYSTDSLPVSDTDAMKAWLNQIWAEKEAHLNRFYDKGYFDGGKESRSKQPISNALYMALIFWTALQVPVLMIFN